ncbi:hypothetical protein ERJ75_000745500 [Trypanosoma vivax]|nr:hypothetical protein ERJ75_000745500 [Trypanosoma vivax]
MGRCGPRRCAEAARGPCRRPKSARQPRRQRTRGPILRFDSAPGEGRRRCNQGDRTAQFEARRKAIGSSGGGGAQLWPARGGAGKRGASAQAAEGARQRRCRRKSAAPRSAHLAALASEAGRVAKGMRTAPAWGQRGFMVGRFFGFEKERGPGLWEESASTFIANLKPVKSNAVQCARAPLSLMAAVCSGVPVGPLGCGGGKCH